MTTPRVAGVRIVALRPARPWFRPGATAAVEIELEAATAVTADAELVLLDLDRPIATVRRRYRLRAGRSRRTERVAIPASPRHGYGLRLSLRWPGGRASASSAAEALEGWWESPRHAALTAFDDPDAAARRIRALRDWHVTVVQHYDWMYRHYRYTPPRGDEFRDALGRRVSHRAVRAAVRAGHEAGIASLAYGSVYGAEREHVDRHPDDRVFDGDGAPLSLGETFFINDVRPGRPWRARLLDEYERACLGFGFDGIHMDTYGPPHRGFGADGGEVDFAALYPGLIEEAAVRLAGVRDGLRVLFNCVEGFPLESVAPAPAAALYLELWPPDVAYRDVTRWIERARSLAGDRQVVIAAYISALRAAGAESTARAGAIEGAVLLTSVIAAAGAYHHVLAEADRLLVEGYYPEARALRRREASELRAAWAFTARYVHLLSDPAWKPLASEGVELCDEAGRPVPLSPDPVAGAVWLRAGRTPDGDVIQLIDLTPQEGDRWDDARQPSPDRSGWVLRWPGARSPVAASPWHRGGEAGALRAAGDGAWRLPRFRRWLLAVEPAGGAAPGPLSGSLSRHGRADGQDLPRRSATLETASR